MSAPAFTQRQIEKAVSGAIKGGLRVRAVEIDPRTGRIVIQAGDPGVIEEPDEIGAWLEQHSSEGRPSR